MNEIFYYFGFFYILIQLISLKKNYISKERESKDFIENVSRKMPSHFYELDREMIRGSMKQVVQFISNKTIGLMISLLLLVWIVIGCIYSQEQKTFILILSISCICFLMPVIQTVIRVISSDDMKKSLIDSTNIVIESSQLKIMSRIEMIIKIMAVGFILYKHFIV